FSLTLALHVTIEIGAFCATCRHIKVLSIFAFCRGIRVPSSVFLLSGGLHNESTRKVIVMIRSTVRLKRYLEASAGFEAGAPGVTEELFEARKSALAMEKANQMKGLCFTPAESAVKVTGVPRLMNSIASLGATFCAFHKGQQATEMRM
ncbi:hypothetical protein IGI04_024533, partial [Brassica rapa subsp. trilocularis]